ncbi:glycoside hydrolase family 95 protein [Streptomyces sp. NBC_01724]|uniref:glycoside hydrolase N-terminal domain-containing protein n=1 Tax=unclassified Streptomyces TaxID=2593676 RepID=UPI002E31A207|nr:glycoside hydrolase N-terminal domain-containing protein [Streptomyces sp. NBC_01724]WTE55904.1 glycoside hydrolase family 95 protein [Streptomyces sp. NBC_01620]
MSIKYTRRSVLAAAAGVVAAFPVIAGGSTATAATPLGSTAAAKSRTGQLLWHESPATDRERAALPIGNGALGAKVFDGVARDRLELDEKSLWTGGPGSKEGYDHGDWPEPRPNAISAMQRIVDEKGVTDPDEVSRRLGNPTYGTVGKVPGFGNYQN